MELYEIIEAQVWFETQNLRLIRVSLKTALYTSAVLPFKLVS